MLENPDVADAYDELLLDLRLAPPLATGNSVLVTSTAPDEGKTTVSLCLALTASLAGRKPLLIDGDLRRSSLTASLGVGGGLGLIEFLLGQAEAAEAIRPLHATETSGAEAISFMPAGRKPATALGAVEWSKARSAFKFLSQQFGIVLLDSPPVLAVNDALLFAKIVDAVLLVVRTGNADLDEIRRVKEQLGAVGTPLVGAVLNRFESKIHGPSKRPYSGYYRRSRS